MRRIAGALIVAVSVAFLLLWFAVPAYVRNRAIEEARARGIAVEIGGVNVRFDNITFEKVHAVDIADSKDPAGPSVFVDVAHATLTLVALTPKELVVHAPALTLPRGESSLRTLAAIHDRLRKPAQDAATTASPKTPTATIERVVVADGTATLWGYTPDGSASRVVVHSLSGELARDPSDGPSAEPGSALMLRGEAIVFTNDRATFGPWSLTLRRAAGVDEQLLDLRPMMPGVATLRRETNAAGVMRVRASIKKQRLQDLGLSASSMLAFGLGAQSAATLDVELDHAITAADNGVRGEAKVEISSFSMPGAPADAPLRMNLTYEGAASAAKIREGTFVFGPFQGTLSGSVDAAASPPKVHLELISTKVPCETLARSMAEQALPGVGAALGALGFQGAGKGLITGQMGFIANVDVDSASLAPPRFAVRPVGTCSLDMPLFSGAR